MPASAAALQVFLILLPGFAAAYVVQLLAVRAKQSDLDKVIEALLFSFLIYITYHLVRGGDVPVAFVHRPPGDDVLEFRSANLLWLAGLSFAYAFALTLYINRDGARFLRKMGITERTSRNSIWNDTFQDIRQQVDPDMGTIVQVELKDGRSLLGVVGYYSDSATECSLFLYHAEWINEDRTTVPINGPGILLTKNAAITSISFLNPPA